MKIIAITGGIGAGKTFVCKILEKLNIPVIYADQIVKELLINDQLLIKQLNNYFKTNFNKNLTKLKLNIFKNKNKLLFIEKLIHPKVIEKVLLNIKNLRSEICIIEIPMVHQLFNILKILDIHTIILVTCNLDLQISRVMHRDRLSKKNVTLIINSQLSIEKLQKRANYILNTDNCNIDYNNLYYEINTIVENIKNL